jgi:hypothetical protein
VSDNLAIYNAVRQPPKEALKDIQAGRLKGKSDINPMWRLKALTEQFGICGVGWKYVITKQWLETGGKDEQAAFVNIDLFIKVEGEWSAAIPGTGGSSFVAAENRGLYTSDECFKMALTDAISVSCKALGFAADVYWNSDRSKYDKSETDKPQPNKSEQTTTPPTTAEQKPINWSAFWSECKKLGYSQEQVHAFAKMDSIKEWAKAELDELYKNMKKAKQEVK